MSNQPTLTPYQYQDGIQPKAPRRKKSRKIFVTQAADGIAYPTIKHNIAITERDSRHDAMRTSQRQLDAFVLEYALEPRFWALGAFIMVFWITSLYLARAEIKRDQHDRYRSISRSKFTTATFSRGSSSAYHPTSSPAEPVFTLWVSQFLTTKSRKSLALVVYAAILGGQLLEGYWVAVTLWRWTAKLVLNGPDQHGTWGHGVYSISIGVMLLMDLTILAFCGFVGLFQMVSIRELLVFRVRETTDRQSPSGFASLRTKS